MELNLQFAGVSADLEVFISGRNQSPHPQVLAGAGKGQSSQHFGGPRNRSEKKILKPGERLKQVLELL